jgi:hypothetical protein
VKNKIFQPTFRKAFKTNSEIITPKLFWDEYLFQIINIDNEVKIKITIHTITITELEGVHWGRFMVLYHPLPTSAKYEAAEAVIITKRGMIK